MPSLAPGPASPPLHIARCGKYWLIASLGQGGMADVFLAVVQGPAGFNKLQVIKQLRSHLAEEPEFLTMFLDEARLAARLNHRNVVQTNEVGEASGQYFLAMEFLEGQPLNRILRRARKAGNPPLGLLLRVVADALAGLHYAHELADYDGTPLNIVHRDASPHNIFVTYEGETKVVDFGIAKAATRSVETRSGLLKGKVSYMAPEQAASGSSVDRQADIFVLGMVLWEVITGRKMWEGLSDMEILQRLLKGNLPHLHEVQPDAPTALIEICARATALDRASRYASAAEMRAAILAYLARSGQSASTEEVGQFVSALFTDKRIELQKTIERQLGWLRANSSKALLVEEAPASPRFSSLPQIDAPADTSDHTPSILKYQSQQTGSLARRTPPPPSAPSGMSTKASVLLPRAAEPARPSTRLLPLVGVAVAAVLVTAVGLHLARKPSPQAGGDAHPGSAQAASATAPASPSPASPSPARAADVMELSIQATPSSAVLSLDGAVLPSNPFTARFPSDGSGHRIRAEAAGYVSESQIVIFNKDVALNLDLEQASNGKASRVNRAVAAMPPRQAPAAAPPPAAPPGTAEAPQPASTEAPVTATPPAKRKRSLDGSNPWESQSPPATTAAPGKPKRAIENPWGQ